MGSLTESIDLKRYGWVLAQTVPRIITTEEENERALSIVESMLEKGERNMTPEEDALLDLLTNLIRDYEATAYPPGEVQSTRDSGVSYGAARPEALGSLSGHRLQKPRLRDSGRKAFHR